VPFVVDLGSGALSATEALGLTEHEPTPRETLKQGADLVCFSGDKLLGGPQAGILAGKARLIAALKKEPMFRALRCEKMVFAALEATVDQHLNQETEQIPVLALLTTPIATLQQRAEKLIENLRVLPLTARIVESKSEIGGGALPRSSIPSIALELTAQIFSPNELAKLLRHAAPAVVGYIAQGKFRLDLRTVFPAQDDLIAEALSCCLTTSP